jgi:hypothetical protein
MSDGLEETKEGWSLGHPENSFSTWLSPSAGFLLPQPHSDSTGWQVSFLTPLLLFTVRRMSS